MGLVDQFNEMEKGIEGTWSALELALRELGHKAEPGAGVGAAQAAFANGI